MRLRKYYPCWVDNRDNCELFANDKPLGDHWERVEGVFEAEDVVLYGFTLEQNQLPSGEVKGLLRWSTLASSNNVFVGGGRLNSQSAIKANTADAYGFISGFLGINFYSI